MIETYNPLPLISGGKAQDFTFSRRSVVKVCVSPTCATLLLINICAGNSNGSLGTET